MTHSQLDNFQFSIWKNQIFFFCSALHGNVMTRPHFSFKLAMSSFPIGASFRCAIVRYSCPPMLIIRIQSILFRKRQCQSSTSHYSLEPSTNLREVSQCLEKAPKIANNKEKVLIIETPCTANKTMTLSHL